MDEISSDREALAGPPADPGAEPLPHTALRGPRRRGWWILLGAVLVLLLAGAAWGMKWYQGWTRVEVLEPQGGLYFVRSVELDVPLFRQGDERWRHEFLAQTPGTIGAEGCALSSAAMVLGYYGIDTDPLRLNDFLNAHDGYTPQGWIKWEGAAAMAPDRVKHVYEDLGSFALLDRNLLRGNPVIVKLRLASGTTHFVVVAGKRGTDYLTRDPGAGASKGLYPLRELGSKILGLRYYEKL